VILPPSPWTPRPATVAIRGHVDAVRTGVDDPWDADARWVSEAHTRRG